MEKFKDTYKLMMKVIHYNISPMGSEKQPKLAKVDLLYAWMSRSVIDIADYMWEVMVNFTEKAHKQANMPLIAYVIWTQVRMSSVGVYLRVRHFKNKKWTMSIYVSKFGYGYGDTLNSYF